MPQVFGLGSLESFTYSTCNIYLKEATFEVSTYLMLYIFSALFTYIIKYIYLIYAVFHFLPNLLFPMGA